LETEFNSEDETLFNELVDKLENLLGEATKGAVSFRFDNGSVVLTVNEVNHGNTTNANYSKISDNLVGEFRVGNNVQVTNGTVAIPAIVTKVSKTGRIEEAQSTSNGEIVIRNGVVLGSNTIQKQ